MNSRALTFTLRQVKIFVWTSRLRLRLGHETRALGAISEVLIYSSIFVVRAFELWLYWSWLWLWDEKGGGGGGGGGWGWRAKGKVEAEEEVELWLCGVEWTGARSVRWAGREVEIVETLTDWMRALFFRPPARGHSGPFLPISRIKSDLKVMLSIFNQ